MNLLLGVPYLCLKNKSSTWLEYFKKYSVNNRTVGVEKCKHMQYDETYNF